MGKPVFISWNGGVEKGDRGHVHIELLALLCYDMGLGGQEMQVIGTALRFQGYAGNGLEHAVPIDDQTVG
jgi:hypothetical protein